jgi:MFS family permease
VLFMAASGVPSPLYVVYQQDWGFSDTTLTVVFAIYNVGLLGALLTVGALSDHVGRRPVLGAAIALESVSLVLFLAANGVPLLMLARFTQGIATGAAVTALGAALVDLNPPHNPKLAGLVNSIVPVGGLAVGALGCGALVQYAPRPTHLVYALLLVGMALAAYAVRRLPETSTLRPGARASLRPRVGIPARLRTPVLAILPIFLSSWALGGLYLSLGPSVAASILGLRNHLVGGLVVTALCGTGAVSAFVLRGWSVDRAMGLAATLQTGGTAVAIVGVELESTAVAAIGTIVAGVGFGASALASFATLARIALPDERGELFAAAYVISYTAFSVPAVAAGFASTSFGLRPTTLVYGVVVVALGLAALVAQRMLLARRPSESES